MSTYRDLVLQKLGLVQWKLRCPVVLNDEILIQLWVHLRLLLISDVIISLNDLFIKDVLYVMCINLKEVHTLAVDQIKDLIFPVKFSCNCWWIGTKVLRDFNGICLNTPSLSVLKRSATAKRALWSQINRVINNKL